LKGGSVGVLSHFAAQGIDLIDEMALGESANRWVAGHASYCAFEGCNEKCGHTHAGGSQGSFGPGMTASDNNNLRFKRCIHSGQDYSNYQLFCEQEIEIVYATMLII